MFVLQAVGTTYQKGSFEVKPFGFSENSHKLCFGKKLRFRKSVFLSSRYWYTSMDNTKPFLHYSIMNFWIIQALSKEQKYHILRKYWYTRNVPVFTNTGAFQYLEPKYTFSLSFFLNNSSRKIPRCTRKSLN